MDHEIDTRWCKSERSVSTVIAKYLYGRIPWYIELKKKKVFWGHCRSWRSKIARDLDRDVVLHFSGELEILKYSQESMTIEVLKNVRSYLPKMNRYSIRSFRSSFCHTYTIICLSRIEVVVNRLYPVNLTNICELSEIMISNDKMIQCSREVFRSTSQDVASIVESTCDWTKNHVLDEHDEEISTKTSKSDYDSKKFFRFV